jgi:hypothetical protein
VCSVARGALIPKDIELQSLQYSRVVPMGGWVGGGCLDGIM